MQVAFALPFFFNCSSMLSQHQCYDRMVDVREVRILVARSNSAVVVAYSVVLAVRTDWEIALLTLGQSMVHYCCARQLHCLREGNYPLQRRKTKPTLFWKHFA